MAAHYAQDSAEDNTTHFQQTPGEASSAYEGLEIGSYGSPDFFLQRDRYLREVRGYNCPLAPLQFFQPTSSNLAEDPSRLGCYCLSNSSIIEHSKSGDAIIIRWTANGEVLGSSDNRRVSPEFKLCSGAGHPEVPFSFMIQPKTTYRKRGGGSFKKARGAGFVTLKTHMSLPQPLRLQMHICAHSIHERDEPKHGPYVNDFREHTTFKMDQSMLEFQNFMDETTQKFVVALKVKFC